jgi:uridine kinase
MDAAAAARARIATLAPARALVLVGIGGRGGSGKTTLARSIRDAQVVATDEFWDGSSFELQRLRTEVIEPLRAGREARFHGFDWARQRPFDTPRAIRPEGVVVVEGVCALHTLFRDAYDFRIWVEAPREVRLARGVARDGEAARSTWESRWMPMEDQYVERDDPVACADLIVDGTDLALGEG